jgi:hypothetical protein
MIINYDHKTFIVQAARVFAPGKPVQAILIIEHVAGAYPRGERLKGAPLR